MELTLNLLDRLKREHKDMRLDECIDILMRYRNEENKELIDKLRRSFERLYTDGRTYEEVEEEEEEEDED